MTEQTPQQRFWEVVSQWLLIAGLTVLFWWAGLFRLLAALFVVFMGEVNKGLVFLGSPNETGFSAYWSVYWRWWAIAWVVLFVILFVVYATWYRHKRPHLVIGQSREGRVIWVKGVRRGLVYALWDVSNYLRGVGSPFDRGSRTRASRPSTATSPGTLQDPLTIPVGRRTKRRVIYFSRPWSLKVERLVVQRRHRVTSEFYHLVIPDGYLANVPDPYRPGRVMLVLFDDQDDFNSYDPEAPERDLEQHLRKSRGLVQDAVAANPEVNKVDFAEGSYPVMGGRRG